MVYGAASSSAARRVGTVETILNSNVLPGPGYSARKDSAASPGSPSASKTRNFFPVMRETSPGRISRAVRKSQQRTEFGGNSPHANLYRETALGETGEGSLLESKLPDIVHMEREQQGRGKAIFAQPREVSMDLPPRGAEMLLPMVAR
jgi:hypothetical protein